MPKQTMLVATEVIDPTFDWDTLEAEMAELYALESAHGTLESPLYPSDEESATMGAQGIIENPHLYQLARYLIEPTPDPDTVDFTERPEDPELLELAPPIVGPIELSELIVCREQVLRTRQRELALLVHHDLVNEIQQLEVQLYSLTARVVMRHDASVYNSAEGRDAHPEINDWHTVREKHGLASETLRNATRELEDIQQRLGGLNAIKLA